MAFNGDVDGIHNILQWGDGMPIFQKVPGKTGFIISVFKMPNVL
jgi:hypothetical protein